MADQSVRHGLPRTDAGEPIEFWVVGMGKLGARELNVSSDIDLVYVYEEDGHTDGPQPITAHEFFAQVARGLSTLIGDTTEDGFVFRVDLALRPNGNSGPAAVSLSMLEEYLQVQGREWERFAWLKSRVVAPRAAVDSGRARALRSIIVSFVYRKYLDYGVFEGLRQLHRKVRDEAQRRAAGRPERANDVKLSRGGIREIEFIVQLLLVVRGGQFPEMRTRSTLRALSKLAAGGLMKVDSARRLAEAYTFLRRVEHRIQYLDDQQTHLLPTVDGDLNWIARSLALTCSADACELLDRLGEIREFVALEFDALLHDGREPAPATNGNGGCRSCGAPPAPLDSEAFLEQLPENWPSACARWCEQPRDQGAARREQAAPGAPDRARRAGQQATRGQCTMDAATRFVDWLEPLLRRESYLALLVERPEVQNRLLRLLGLARWPMRYLMRHPGVIDELADERLLHSRFDAAVFSADLEARHVAWERSGQADPESLLDTLRRAHHAEVFRTLVRDVEAHITVEQVADDLSALADATLERTRRLGLEAPEAGAPAGAPLRRHRLRQARRQGARLRQRPRCRVPLRRRRRTCPRGLWRLRAQADRLADLAHRRRRAVRHRHRAAAERQLGDAGHLDGLVREVPERPRQQHRLDLGAPGADAGALVRRPRRLAPRFEAVRRAVLAAPRDHAPRCAKKCARCATSCAQRGRSRPAAFDVKHSPGGMVDAEFAVQYLVLAHSGAHPELLDNDGNIALLQRAEDLRPAARPASAPARPMPTASCAARSTAPGWTSSPRRYRPSSWLNTATPSSPCGARCSVERSGAARLGRTGPADGSGRAGGLAGGCPAPGLAAHAGRPRAVARLHCGLRCTTARCTWAPTSPAPRWWARWARWLACRAASCWPGWPPGRSPSSGCCCAPTCCTTAACPACCMPACARRRFGCWCTIAADVASSVLRSLPW